MAVQYMETLDTVEGVKRELGRLEAERSGLNRQISELNSSLESTVEGDRIFYFVDDDTLALSGSGNSGFLKRSADGEELKVVLHVWMS
jgi:hypothetical protein